MDSLKHTEPDQGTTFIGTSNHGFGTQAQEELRRLFPKAAFTTIVPTEIYMFTVPESKKTVTDHIKLNEPVFVRHIQPVDAQFELDGTAADLSKLQETVRSQLHIPQGFKIAVQARKLDGASLAYTPFNCKEAIDEVIVRECKSEPVVKDPDFIVSVFLTDRAAYVGVSAPEDNLSDWAGGAIRFQKEEGQISRAKFKLLEAERRFGLDYSRYRTALDIGAAPGGWTSLLLERGCSVTAVDPARLDAQLLKHPKLTYLAKNAGDVTFKQDAFELLVCDMSWSPRQMAQLVKQLLYALKSGGTAIITIKLMHKKAFQTMRDIVEALSPELQLQQAKQLFHNREELTMFFIKL
ncbi:SAM-dependent methyltransferase [Paenibacillus thalictri]|uniref:Methyltransferase domain-containing protein n=1 Tax=Paenibacillus thalictri TaxID=2527873 RepID=A0A4Q9DTK3_9BACL|nr:SAM-dependent methyltransferase [Paenibacillus thalictri]TBL80238.1 methyltransferase domain-containing protein [Paenibacillus thalictri]